MIPARTDAHAVSSIRGVSGHFRIAAEWHLAHVRFTSAFTAGGIGARGSAALAVSTVAAISINRTALFIPNEITNPIQVIPRRSEELVKGL